MRFPTDPTISVVIPVHNGGKIFHQCLSSLVNAVPLPKEIIVVADGDTDGSSELAEKFSVKVVKIPTCGGPAKARNLGAKIAQGDILFFIDADVAIYPDTLSKVAETFQKYPHLTALIGSYDDAPGARNFLSQYKNLFHHYTHQTASEEASTFWGACGAIRREIFLGLGGFDEKYRRPCIEDIELGYRLKAAGYQIRLEKTIQVKHLKRWEVFSLLRADFFYRALPWVDLILRDRQLINDLNLKWSSRLSTLLTYGLIAAFIVGFWVPVFFAIASVIALALLIINAPVYQFFLQKRGWWFTAKVIPWHWLYYFYSGLAFAIGMTRHWFSKKPSVKTAYTVPLK